MRLCEDVDRQVRPGDCFALLLHDLERLVRHPSVVPRDADKYGGERWGDELFDCHMVSFPTELRPNGFELAARNMKRLAPFLMRSNPKHGCYSIRWTLNPTSPSRAATGRLGDSAPRHAQTPQGQDLLLLLVLQDIAHPGEGLQSRRPRQRPGRALINCRPWVSTEDYSPSVRAVFLRGPSQ